MSGGYPQHPPGYGYGAPPAQPYSAAPYTAGAPPPPQPYGVPYATAPYGAPSAPYGAPPGEKPPKDKQQAHGPKEFTAVFYSLQNWRAIFEKFDRDRSGKIDANELREALLSLGFSVSPVVLDLLVSKFDKTGGKNKAIEYDNFIEYGFYI
ncbi:EF-hand domain - like 10 [Theobroma cacao]|nr:EF-hand domain - like 10 [Theobroma cacao]